MVKGKFSFMIIDRPTTPLSPMLHILYKQIQLKDMEKVDEKHQLCVIMPIKTSERLRLMSSLLFKIMHLWHM